jgi:hypothetical protein
VSQSIAAAQKREYDLDREWRERVERGLEKLENGQRQLTAQVADMARENGEDHATLTGRIETLIAGLQNALDAANKSLEAKSRLIRALVMIVLALLSFIAGVKAHVLGIVKDIGF